MAAASHGTRGRWLAMAVVVVLFASAVGAAAASAAPAAHAAARTNTLVMRGSSADHGKYEIIVWVRSRTKHSRVVRVYLTGQKSQTVRANPWWGARVYYVVKLKGSQLTIRTVNSAPAVAVKYSLIRKSPAAAPASSPNSTSNATPSTTPASASSSSSAGSSSSGGSQAPAAPPSPPATTTAPDPYGPYTTLAWEDNFAQDYVNGGSEPNNLPSSATWGFDNWGGCGTNTLSTNVMSNSPNVTQVVNLNANGLAINAISNGNGSWSSAQLDTVGKVSFGPGSTIEARINMPYGQGLCPAFWMLSDGATSTQGEIDVVEAPSFGASATAAYFDLHGPGTPSQKWEEDETALGSLANTWHNYAVTWTSNSITWSIDGVPYATANASNIIGNDWTPYEQTFHLILDLAVGGWPCTDQPVGPGCSPPSSATMEVQWVKVFN